MYEASTVSTRIPACIHHAAIWLFFFFFGGDYHSAAAAIIRGEKKERDGKEYDDALMRRGGASEGGVELHEVSYYIAVSPCCPVAPSIYSFGFVCGAAPLPSGDAVAGSR